MHNMPENFFLHKFTEEFYIKIYVMVNTVLPNIIIEQYFGKYLIWGL